VAAETMNENAERGIARRKVLKRIGAGAVVAWTAPIVTSIRTPAFAQTDVDPNLCNDPGYCGNDVACGPDGSCLCYTDIDQGPGGIGHCGPIIQSCPGPQPCNHDEDCPFGSRCVTRTCCGDVCVPNCVGPPHR
jgi:hypothetical protein